MIVVDANVLAFYVIEGKRTADANTLREMDAEWIVPAFWCVEFQSILWKYSCIGGLPMKKALDLLDNAIAMFSPNEVAPAPDIVLRDALNLKITVYDTQYVSLAKQFGVRYVTEDVPVQKACPDIAISLEDFLKQSTGGNLVRQAPATYDTRRKRRARG